jgi:hypothetical protein
MPQWAITLLVTVFGSFTTGVAVLVVTRRSERRTARRKARLELLDPIIPALTPEKHPILSSGSYRSVLADQLDRLKGVTFVCSKSEQVAAASLARAWRDAVPLGLTEPTIHVSEDQCREIETSRAALRLLVEKRLRPFNSRLKRPVKWP